MRGRLGGGKQSANAGEKQKESRWIVLASPFFHQYFPLKKIIQKFKSTLLVCCASLVFFCGHSPCLKGHQRAESESLGGQKRDTLQFVQHLHKI